MRNDVQIMHGILTWDMRTTVWKWYGNVAVLFEQRWGQGQKG
jgi:hypothetical protein